MKDKEAFMQLAREYLWGENIEWPAKSLVLKALPQLMEIKKGLTHCNINYINFIIEWFDPLKGS